MERSAFRNPEKAKAFSLVLKPKVSGYLSLKIANQFLLFKCFVRESRKVFEIVPGRFELPSSDPKSKMIDRYTTGLLLCS